MNRLQGTNPLDLLDPVLNREEKSYVRKLAASSRLKNRKLSIDYLGNCWRPRKNHKFVLSVTEPLIQDHRVRHEALGIIANYIARYPSKVWPLIRKYASDRNVHIRGAVAAAVLEVLLSDHHGAYFPKVKRIVLNGDKRFLNTLTMCWPFGQKQEHWRKLVLLMKQAGGNMDRVYRSDVYPFPAKG